VRQGPALPRLLEYARRRLGLSRYLDAPGDGRTFPQIPASELLWALLASKILREPALSVVEWLAREAGTQLGVRVRFGDDALAYFLERLSPAAAREGLRTVLRRAKRNKAFARSVWIGLAVDGTGAGHGRRWGCAACHPQLNEQHQVLGHIHKCVAISVVGTEAVLPFDIEPYGPEESELTAAKRLVPRAVQGLGRGFADYLVADGEYAGGPFLELVQHLGLPVVVRLKQNLPDLCANVRRTFQGRPATTVFAHDGDLIELWDGDIEATETLPWPSVRVLRYRQHRRKGDVIEAEWLTTLPRRRVGARALFHLCKTRWQIENQTFNDAKSRYGLEHIPHHERNSLLLHALLTCLALCIERLYRLRHLRRGRHVPPSAIELLRGLRLSIGACVPFNTG